MHLSPATATYEIPGHRVMADLARKNLGRSPRVWAELPTEPFHRYIDIPGCWSFSDPRLASTLERRGNKSCGVGSARQPGISNGSYDSAGFE